MRFSLALVFAASFVCAPFLRAADATVADANGPVATLTLPADWSASNAHGKTYLFTSTKHPHIQVWSVSGSIAETEAAIAVAVVDEVKHFTVTKRDTLTIGNKPAVRLTGTGEEADDGDPANAEVTLFTVGTHTLLCISHGEGDGALKASAALAAVLVTAK